MLGRKINQEHARKAIKHIIEQEKLGKAIKRKWCGESYIHTPKPEIQSMEPRRGRLSARILPCDCG